MGKGAHTAAIEPEKRSIREEFAPFLQPTFQAAQFASEALAGSSSSAQVCPEFDPGLLAAFVMGHTATGSVKCEGRVWQGSLLRLSFDTQQANTT